MAAQDNILKMEEKVVLGLQHDPTIWISEGASRFSTSWKNKKIRWAELLEDWRVFVVIRGGKVLVPRPKKKEERKDADDQRDA